MSTKYLYIYSIPQAKLWQNSWFDCYKILKAWIFDQKHLTGLDPGLSSESTGGDCGVKLP